MSLHRLVWLMDTAAEVVLAQGGEVSFAEAKVLMAIRSKQPLTQRALADCLAVTPAAVTKLLPSYVERGWVLIEVDPDQPRRHFVSLTSAGEAREAAARGCLEQAFTQVMREAEVEIPVFGRSVEALIEELDAWVKAEAR